MRDTAGFTGNQTMNPRDSSAAAPPEVRRSARVSASELFRTFAEMSIYGFGGVMPWARRMLVDRRRWLDDREFAELLAVGQILP